jgi:arginase
MRIHAFEAPYDSGRLQERMGLGPSALLKAGLINRLRFLGHEVIIERIRIADEFPSEIKTTFRLANELSSRISRERAQGGLPVVLSGNCNAALGTICGLDPERTGVLWLDAHGEFNTPETTRSGFLDGMGLAIATGHCWRRLAESVHNFSRLAPKNVVLVGVREVDPEEQDLLDKAGVQQIPAQEVRERGVRSLLTPVLQSLNRRVDAVYVHFDLDVLDPSVARWNQWTPPAGLSLEHVEAALDLLAGGPPITAVGFASHDPQIDPDNSFEAARRLFDRALAVAGA